MSADDAGFLARWSQRKAQAREGVPLPPAPLRDRPAVAPAVAPAGVAEAAAPLSARPDPRAPGQAGAPAAASESAAPAPPLPTLADVAGLTRESDFSRFVAPGVEGEVKNAALKKLFADAHFNTMDGLDTYIDDYSRPDPLPLASLRKMAQAAFLGLVQEPAPDDGAATAQTAPSDTSTPEPESSEGRAPAPAAATDDPDEDPDLRLQSHDAAGCGGAEDGARTHQPHRG